MITVETNWVANSTEVLDLTGTGHFTVMEDGKIRTTFSMPMLASEYQAFYTILRLAARAGRQEIAEYLKPRLSTLIPEHLL